MSHNFKLETIYVSDVIHLLLLFIRPIRYQFRMPSFSDWLLIRNFVAIIAAVVTRESGSNTSTSEASGTTGN